MVTDLAPIIRAAHRERIVRWVMLVVYCILAPLVTVAFIEGVW